MASIRSDDGWLFLDFRYRGERCREYLNLRKESRDARSEANRIKRQIEAEIRAGSFDYARRFPNSVKLGRLGLRSPRNPTLVEFALVWLEEQAPHLAPSTRYWYRCMLTAYVFSHPIAAPPIAEISEGHINAFMKDLLERPTRSGRRLTARSVNAVLARLRTIFEVARRRKLIADDPTAYVTNLRETKPEVDPFDFGEARALLDAAQGWERPFLALLLFAGLRPNEALALTWPGHRPAKRAGPRAPQRHTLRRRPPEDRKLAARRTDDPARAGGPG